MAAILVVAVGAIGYLGFRAVDPWAREAAELDRIGGPRPPGRLLGARRGGGLLCIDACPSVVRSYDVTGQDLAVGSARSRYVDRLSTAGYRVDTPGPCTALGLGTSVRVTSKTEGTRGGHQAEVDLFVSPRAGMPAPGVGVAEPVTVAPDTAVERIDLSVSTDHLL